MKRCLKGQGGGIADLDSLSVDLQAAEHLPEIDAVLLDLLQPAPQLHCHPVTDGTGSGEWDAVQSPEPGWGGLLLSLLIRCTLQRSNHRHGLNQRSTEFPSIFFSPLVRS